MTESGGRGTRVLLVFAFASQASLSIVQWGIGALGPDLQQAYGLTAAGLGALLAAGSVGNAITLVAVGAAIDRFGPRFALIGGGIVSGGVLVLAGTAHQAWVLGLGLLIAGAAGALVSVAGAVSVFHGFGDDRRGLALGVRQAAIAAGGLIASFMLPGLAALGGVRLSLAASGVLTALFAVAFGLASPGGPLAGTRNRSRVAPVEVLRTPGMARLMLVGLLLVSALTTILTFSVPAIRAAGASPATGSLLFALVSVTAMAARVFWGRLADGAGGTRRRATLFDIGVVAAVGAVLYWLAGHVGVPAQCLTMPVFAFGALGFNGVLYLIAGELAGADRAGQAVGFGSTVLFGGSALAAVPLGMLADRAGYQSLWLAAAGLAAAGALVTRGLPARRAG